MPWPNDNRKIKFLFDVVKYKILQFYSISTGNIITFLELDMDSPSILKKIKFSFYVWFIFKRYSSSREAGSSWTFDQ
jgi:hypothetical protein